METNARQPYQGVLALVISPHTRWLPAKRNSLIRKRVKEKKMGRFLVTAALPGAAAGPLFVQSALPHKAVGKHFPYGRVHERMPAADPGVHGGISIHFPDQRF